MFHIGPEDLRENQSGALSERQLHLLRRCVYWIVAGAVVIVLGLISVMYFAADRPLAFVQYALAGVLLVAGAATGLYTVRGIRAAMRVGVVECLAGPVRLNLRYRNGWWLTVQEQSFRLPVPFWHVVAGMPYRVYIAPAAKRIVAMEPDA